MRTVMLTCCVRDVGFASSIATVAPGLATARAMVHRAEIPGSPSVSEAPIGDGELCVAKATSRPWVTCTIEARSCPWATTFSTATVATWWAGTTTPCDPAGAAAPAFAVMKVTLATAGEDVGFTREISSVLPFSVEPPAKPQAVAVLEAHGVSVIPPLPSVC